MSAGPNGRIFPPTDRCEFISASFGAPGKPSLFLLEEFDRAIGPVQLNATWSPLPNMPGFHGGLTQFSITSAAAPASIPEPSTMSLLTIAAAGIFLCTGLRRTQRRCIRRYDKTERRLLAQSNEAVGESAEPVCRSLSLSAAHMWDSPAS